MIKIFQIGIVGWVITGSILLSGCMNDNDDMYTVGDQAGVNTYYPTLATVESVEPVTIISDTYGILIPTNPDIFEKNNADSIGQRVFLNVAFQSKPENQSSSAQEVLVLNLYNVPTRSATDLRESEDIDLNHFENDPVQIIGTSISNEHLNIEFNFKGSSSNNTHDFNLLLPQGTQLNANGMLPVILRHNAKSDTPTGWFWGVASFTLKSVPEYQEKNFKGFLITYNSGADSQAVWEAKKEN